MTQTVTEFLAALPPDRAAELKLVRAAIRKALPKGYEEAVAGKALALEWISDIVRDIPMAKWVEIARSARKPKT